MIFKLKNGEQR